MIENPVLTEYRVSPISQDKIVHTEDFEVAYALESVSHGTCATTKECKSKLKDIPAMPNTLGFEIDLECDFCPSALRTYNSDKTLNAEYGYGEHQPGGNRHPEPCKLESALCNSRRIRRRFSVHRSWSTNGGISSQTLRDRHRFADRLFFHR